MNTRSKTEEVSVRTAVAASIGISLAELAVLAWRRPELGSTGLLRLGDFALCAGVIVGLAAALPARLRKEPGVAWSVALWCALATLAALRADHAPKSMLAVDAAVACALAWVVSRVLIAGLGRAPFARTARTWSVIVIAAAGGLAALAIARREAPPESAASDHAPRPSVLLVTIDTLRADFLGCYGRAGARTPTIDALAATGHRFENATTHTVLTGPSHATILTGRLPARHGLLENLQRLPRSVPTIAEGFGSHGYRTGAFVAGYPLKQSASALPKRFEHSDDDFRDWKLLPAAVSELALGRWLAFALEHSGFHLDPHSRSAAAVTDVATEWLDDHDARPFLAWVHYFDPHLPYEPPRDLLADATRSYRGPNGADWYQLSPAERGRIAADPIAVQHMNELYDAEIASVDRELARLVAAARRAAGSSGCWIVITADHGESFGEHGIFWERDLYEDSVHVPLILCPPVPLEAPHVVHEPVGLIDIAPTLLEIAGADFDGDGRSLSALARGEPSAPREYSAEILTSVGVPLRRQAISLRSAEWKLIVRAPGWDNDEFLWHAATTRELYDLEHDPKELDDRAAHEPARTATLERAAEALHRIGERAELELGANEMEKLRQLGYAR